MLAQAKLLADEINGAASASVPLQGGRIGTGSSIGGPAVCCGRSLVR
jgi:hypothetical protein